MKITRGMIRLGLTIFGCIGVGVTSVLSAKCHEKAKEQEDPKEKAKYYIPAVVSGVTTCACIIGNHNMSSKEIAAVTATATYAIANRNRLEEKLKEYLPEEEVQELRKENCEVYMQPSDKSHIEETGHGRLRFIESYSGREFYSDIDSVRKAEDGINNQLRRGRSASLNDFYDRIGITKSEFGDEWIWVPNITFSYDEGELDEPVIFEHKIYMDETDGTPTCIIEIWDYPMEARMVDRNVSYPTMKHYEMDAGTINYLD